MKAHMTRLTQSFAGVITIAAIGLMLTMSSHADAASLTLVEDTFTDAGSGTFVVAAPGADRTPEQTIAGRAWLQSQTTSAGSSFESSVSGGRAHLETNLGAAVDITSTGGYVKPTRFDIELTFNLDGVTNNTPPRDGRGAYLGFWSSLPTTGDSIGNMRGVFVNPEDGQLHLWDGASASNSTSLQNLAYNGTWDASADHTLSFHIDTTTGDITDFVLDATAYNWAPTTIFTDANTQLAGFGLSAAAANETADFDNFRLSTIPTPAALPAGLMIMGLLTLKRSRL